MTHCFVMPSALPRPCMRMSSSLPIVAKSGLLCAAGNVEELAADPAYNLGFTGPLYPPRF